MTYAIQSGRLVVCDDGGKWLFTVSQASWPRVKSGVKDALIPITEDEAAKVAAAHIERHRARAG